MKDRKALVEALKKLENEQIQFRFTGNRQGWKLLVDEIVVAELTHQQKSFIERYSLTEGGSTVALDEVETQKKIREDVKTALRSLLVKPSVPRNLDVAVAESIMGWEFIESFSCGCITYKSSEQSHLYVANRPGIECTVHEAWSPSTKSEHAKELVGKVFLCCDGRQLAIKNINHAGAVQSTGTDMRTTVIFEEQTAKTCFEVVDVECIWPAAVCVAALRQAGINVVLNKSQFFRVGEVPRRYVACLDVLGFKNALDRDVFMLSDAYFTAIALARRTQTASYFVPNNPGVHTIGVAPEGKEVRHYPHIYEVAVFSDSIFVFTDDESLSSLEDLCKYCFLVYREFLRHGLVLRGGIAGGEAMVMPDESFYLGQAIVEAWKLEESLKLTGIVLQSGLSCNSSVEATVSFKDGTKQQMHVPTFRDAMVNGESVTRNFQIARITAGADQKELYDNSEPVVAAMLKVSVESLRPAN